MKPKLLWIDYYESSDSTLSDEASVLVLVPQKAAYRTILYQELQDESSKKSFYVKMPDLLFAIHFHSIECDFDITITPHVLGGYPKTLAHKVCKILQYPNVGEYGIFCLGREMYLSKDKISEEKLIEVSLEIVNEFWKTTFNDSMERGKDWDPCIQQPTLVNKGKDNLYEILSYYKSIKNHWKDSPLWD